MPIYTFLCETCGSKTEELMSIEKGKTCVLYCEKCSNPMIKIPSTFKFDMLKPERFFKG